MALWDTPWGSISGGALGDPGYICRWILGDPWDSISGDVGPPGLASVVDPWDISGVVSLGIRGVSLG